jgi:hypothetical protein
MLDAGGCLTIDAVVRHLTRGASPQNVVRHLSLDQTWSKRTLVMGTASRLRLVTPRQLRREDTHTTHTHTHTHTTQAPRAGDSASLSLSLSLSLSSNPSILLQPDAHPAITTRARAHTHTHTQRAQWQRWWRSGRCLCSGSGQEQTWRRASRRSWPTHRGRALTRCAGSVRA